jgi:hypothetical protein
MAAVNPDNLVTVAMKLRELGVRFAFVGGCALPFIVDTPFAATIRPTLDVDVIVEASTPLTFSKLDEQLRSIGFKHDMSVGAPRCRWSVKGIKVDIMPASPDVAEFGSRWFEEAMGALKTHEIEANISVPVIGPSYLLATKMDAFFNRGAGDYYGSRDLEDIIALMEGCSRLIAELQASSADLRQHVSVQMGRLLDTSAFVEAVPAHLSRESPPDTLERVMVIARKIALKPRGSSSAPV